jgi:hypothetical protein
MANPILDGINAVIVHINKHAAVPAETLEAEKSMREELSKLPKKDLIEKLINLQLKRTVKVVQADLVGDILCDPKCAILTYEEISETILEHLNTDMKFTVDNLRWYKSNLQNQKGLPVLNRMATSERNAINRQLLKGLK